MGEKPLTHAELAAEAHRAQMVWYREYMAMGRFATSHMREANLLTDAVYHALKLLDKDDDQNVVGEIVSVLKTAVRKANALRLDSVQPQPAPVETRKAFVWMAEQEGLSVATVSDSFISAETQALWLAFQKGALHAQRRMDQPPAVKPEKKRWLG